MVAWMPRALLLEFASIDRFQRGRDLPFVRGYLLSRGVDAPWLRFALPADVRSGSGEPGFRLDGEDRERLARRVLELGPTHVLCSHEPAPSLVRELRAASARAPIGFFEAEASRARAPVLKRGGGEPAGTRQVHATPASLDEFFGLPARAPMRDAAEGLYESVVPDFAWEPGNRAAETTPSLPFLLCGEECTYARSVGANPHFGGVDLSRCARPQGCSFCVRPARRASPPPEPLGVIRTQLEALARTHPTRPPRLAVRAVGEPFLLNIERVAPLLGELDLAPVDLLIDGRADVVLGRERALREALGALRAGPHALHLCLVGVESFCAEELARFNKGIDWRTNLRLVRLLFDLEAEFPAHFGFRSHGGLSVILFTPWTRARDLSLNLAIFRRCGLVPLCGKLFGSRLRLYPDLPLHALAQRDGLLLDGGYGDPMLDTARRNFYPDEVPWRFADPGLEAVNRLMARLGPGAVRTSGSLAAAIESLRSSEPAARDPVALAEAIVDAAMAEPGEQAERTASPEQLLARARRFVRADGVRWVPHEPAVESRHDRSDRELSSTALLSFALGHKPVARLEGLSDAQLLEMRRVAAGVAKVVRAHRGVLGVDLFIGHDPEAVQEAIACTERMVRPANEAEAREATARAGILLGYPRCCTEAFAGRDARLRVSYSWQHALVRLETPGEVPFLLNPGSEMLLDYVPCSLTCAETLRRARELRDAHLERRGEVAVAELDRQLRNPWLLFVDRQGEAIELEADADPVGRFRYRTGVVRGANPLNGAVAAGDEIELEEQNLVVLRGGRPIAALGARAFVWWHRRAIQPELWSEVLALRFQPARATLPGADGGCAGAPAPGEAAHRLARALRRLLGAARAREARFAGFRVAELEPEGEDRARMTLERGEERLRVVAAPRRDGLEGYAHAGPLTLFVPHEERVEDWARDRALRALAAFLQHAVRARLAARR
jgi:hypothetical protein